MIQRREGVSGDGPALTQIIALPKEISVAAAVAEKEEEEEEKEVEVVSE